MKNKPLGFQVWVILSTFIFATTVVVAMTIFLMINEKDHFVIDWSDPYYLGSLLKLTICVVIVGIIVSKVISNIVTEPIRHLEHQLRLIAEKKWVKNIEINRKDEIGKLTYSIRRMQDELERLDKEEDLFLQALSHELKTPIMVIKNYCQALRDELYINNSREDTIRVIEEEANLLATRCKKIIYASSLDYILEKEKKLTPVNLQKVLIELLDRVISPNQNSLSIHTKLEPFFFMGIEEKFSIAIENLLDNALRYANGHIHVITELEDSEFLGEEKWICLRILNDGACISDEVKIHLFDKFYKGSNGCFGLGLFITQKIIEFHRGNIAVGDTQDLVEFVIKIPLIEIIQPEMVK